MMTERRDERTEAEIEADLRAMGLAVIDDMELFEYLTS
jgi:hypothetical protein